MRDIVTNPANWSAIADTYDEVARVRLTPFSEEAIAWAQLDEHDAVIDVACGPGTTTLLAARRAVRSVSQPDWLGSRVPG